MPTEQVIKGGVVAERTEKQLASALSNIQSWLDFGKEDLARGDYRRVAADLWGVALAASQAVEHLDGNTMEIPPMATPKRPAKPPEPRRRVRGKSRSTDFKQAVLEVLQERGEMKLKDLMTELTSRGVDLPGQGKSANLTVSLNRMDEIDRPKYGHYALKENGNE